MKTRLRPDPPAQLLGRGRHDVTSTEVRATDNAARREKTRNTRVEVLRQSNPLLAEAMERYERGSAP